MAQAIKKALKTSISIFKDSKNVEYRGRLLGFIDEKQYRIIANKKQAALKLATSATMSFKEILKVDDPEDLRLVFALISRNSIPLIQRHLLITEPVSMITYVNETSNNISITCKEGSFVEIREENVSCI